MLGPHDDASCVQPRARRGDAGGLVADSRTCARNLQDEAADARSGRRGDRGQHDHRPRSAARAPELAATPIYTIPNPVDMTALDRRSRARGAADRRTRTSSTPASSRRTRACSSWCDAYRQTRPHAGRSSSSATARCGRARGRRARAPASICAMLGWRDRAEVWTWMRHATALMFPSYGPESLSRVLIEASALGAPIAAMDTGGTRDIIQPGRDRPAVDGSRRISPATSRASRTTIGCARRSAPRRAPTSRAILGGLGRRPRRAGLPIAAPARAPRDDATAARCASPSSRAP